MLQLIRGLHNVSRFSNQWEGCVVTIGNFDGLHIAHQEMIDRLLVAKRALNYPSVVIVFEPQPKEYFNASPPMRLMRLVEKYKALQSYPVDFLLCLYFNRELARRSAEQFIQTILVGALNVKHVVVGADFRFGCRRAGDVDLLKRHGAFSGFSVDAVPIKYSQGKRVSSTRVRQCLLEGKLDCAKALLGRHYTCLGRVVRGDQRGRTLGFPTANVRLPLPTPLSGVYVVTVSEIDQPSEPVWPAVANVGNRPTVDGEHYWLEVHIFNFNGDLYGHRLSIAFHAKLRDEKKFDSLDALVKQIGNDVREAKQYFERV